ncbi:hypothetical protein CT43_CH0574 [Bacillus thuringiensis serovar chinensis CT-43]|nr:hypothetical protein CT43_CH0574 [Bacillus thuringiensis serovar chinensis CT-43]
MRKDATDIASFFIFSTKYDKKVVTVSVMIVSEILHFT